MINSFIHVCVLSRSGQCISWMRILSKKERKSDASNVILYIELQVTYYHYYDDDYYIIIPFLTARRLEQKRISFFFNSFSFSFPVLSLDRHGLLIFADLYTTEKVWSVNLFSHLEHILYR